MQPWLLEELNFGWVRQQREPFQVAVLPMGAVAAATMAMVSACKARRAIFMGQIMDPMPSPEAQKRLKAGRAWLWLPHCTTMGGRTHHAQQG